MVKCRILVPTCDNAGETFPVDKHARFERRALELFGGYTYAGEVSGAWVNEDEPEGHVYYDTSRAYDIAVPSILDTSRVKGFADYAAREYDQKSIYVEVGGHVELYKPNWRLGAVLGVPLRPGVPA